MPPSDDEREGKPENPLTSPKIFRPVKIAVKDQVEKFQQMVSNETPQMINLD